MLIEKYNLLNNNGIIICEYEEEIPCCTYPLLCDKKYGKTKIKIFKKDSNQINIIIKYNNLIVKDDKNNILFKSYIVSIKNFN